MENAGKPNGELMRKATMYAGRQLEQLFALGTAAGMTDTELLEQFVSGDRESSARAFEVIVDATGQWFSGSAG